MTAAPDAPRAAVEDEDAGYHKSLTPRQMQMIAIGGAIGTGLFLGAGGRLLHAGPGLFVVYAICGVFVYFVLRALGELVLYRATTGSFVSYAREFLGEKTAYVAGWAYWLNWAMATIVDTTAIATYLHFWTALRVVPQWTLALGALALVVTVNMVSVKLFGEFEFWAALIKVAALVTFLVVGTVFVAGRYPIEGHETGLSMVADNGGWLPLGALPLVLAVSGVVFAYAGVEMVGTAAGETAEPAKVMPRAINSVISRIALFYVGSVFLLALLLPYTAYSSTASPFVTFFSAIGLPGAGSVMNLVVLTAAFSSLNAGLYSTGRTLKSMAVNGTAPAFTGRMSSRGVPYGGILLTASLGLMGVALNALVPSDAFEIVLNISALGILVSWATIMLCQLRFFRLSREGKVQRPAFRMWGAPYTGYITLVFLAVVLVLIALDYPVGTFTVGSLVVLIPLLVAGWFLVRGRVGAIAQAREELASTSD